MARITAPLLSFGASGQIGKTLVAGSWKGRPYMRQYVIPSNPRSAGQTLTRNTFKYLQALYQYLPAGAIGAWELYAQNSRFTPRNGWGKQNIGALRNQTDLALMKISPAAGSGLVAASFTATENAGDIDIVLTAPALPTGWTIVAAHAMAVRSVDPQTSDVYDVVADSDNADPYTFTLTGLTSGETYEVGGWFEYTRSNGESAFGASLQDTVAIP